MFLIAAFGIMLSLKLCICNSDNNQNEVFEIMNFDDMHNYESNLCVESITGDTININLRQAASNQNNVMENENVQECSAKNSTPNTLNSEIDKFLDFLEYLNPSNQVEKRSYESTFCEYSLPNQSCEATNEIEDDTCKPSQAKRIKIDEDFNENDHESKADENPDFNSTLNSNISPPLSPSISEVERELTLATQDLFNKMIDELKQQYFAINQKIETIKELYDRARNLIPFIEYCHESYVIIMNFVKNQERLLANITFETEYQPVKNMDFINLLNNERLKTAAKVSIENLSKEYIKFTNTVKNYLNNNMEKLIDTEFLSLFYEILELYLKSILKYENILMSDHKYVKKYFKYEYSIREYEVFDNPIHDLKIFSVCMNHKYIYVIYGKCNEGAACDILRISNQDKSKQPKICSFYTSRGSNDRKYFQKVCKRILTDSEGLIYILQMEYSKPTILVINENFQEVDLIDSRRIINDDNVPNAPVIVDICIHENKLYLLDSANPYIYCYNLNFEYEKKIEIPGNIFISRRKSFFGFSQNYVFIVEDKSFFAFDPNTNLIVNPKNFINPTQSKVYSESFTCLNENIIALKVGKTIYLSKFEIKNTGISLNFKHILRYNVGLFSILKYTGVMALLKSPEDNKIKVVFFSDSTVRVIEYN